jgi:protein tyrosine/serine phosphatase
MTTSRLSRRTLQAALLTITINLIAIGQVAAQSAGNLKFPDIKIKNFGQMDERFFRGAQPKEDDFKSLAALGINTIIDLTNEPTNYGKRAAEAAGMRYVNIPMSSTSRPRDEQIEQFLKVAGDSATGRFFVHCEGGRHRTGVVGAVYRIQNGWDFDRAYKEMKVYDYYSRWGHGSLKDYVEDYSQASHSIEASSGAASSNH